LLSQKPKQLEVPENYKAEAVFSCFGFFCAKNNLPLNWKGFALLLFSYKRKQ